MNFEEMTKEELIDYIRNLDNETAGGKYGLVWDKEKEPEQIVVECDKQIPILEENKELSFEVTDGNNLLIEGDNFHSLSVLNYTHKEMIDMIYIDPPYNTGNKDFIYNDKFVESEDGYKHSKWLNFMDKRLKLARNLLKEDGFIFISIDDNEMAQLKLLCDKIFNENNFVACFTWVRKKKGSFLSDKVRKMTEYILCYKKSDNAKSKLFGESAYSDKLQPLINRPNPIKELIMPAMTIETTLKDGIYESGFYGNEGTGIEFLNSFEVKDSMIVDELKLKGHFRWSQEFFNNEIKMGTKVVLSSKFGFNSLRYNQGDKIKTPSTLINAENNVGTNEDATLELQNIFNMKPNEVFSYSKPTSLIKYLVKMVTYNNPEAIILDFFAGSGTTGQAVLELNKEDDGNRKFIVCTNNENDICLNVTYNRLSKVMKGYNEKEALGGTLKYYKTEFVDNTNNRDQLYYDLTEKCIPMLCIKEDCYKKIKITKEYSIYTNESNSKYTCIYHDLFGEQENEFTEQLKNISKEKIIYKFSLGDYIDESIFDGVENYKIEAIPYKIVEVYRKLVKLSKEEN